MIITMKTLLFDLDGTLIDTVDLIRESFDHAVRTILGARLPAHILLQNMGRPLEVQMQSFSTEKADALLDAYTEHNLAAHDLRVSAYPGVARTLSWLEGERRFKLGVVTSKKRDLALRGLELTGLAKFFDIVVAKEDTTRHKPDPAPVLLAVSQLRTEARQSLFIGDSPYDLAAGRRAGALTAAALWGPFNHSLLRAEGPDYELADLAGLRDILV